jgi:ATP synthase protein I
VRRTVVIQVLLIAAVAGLFAGFHGWSGLWAALFGGVAALTNTLLLHWRVAQGKRNPHCDAQRHLRAIYLSSLERLVAVVALLAIGFGLLKLMPLALLAGFVAGQLAAVVSGLIKDTH